MRRTPIARSTSAPTGWPTISWRTGIGHGDHVAVHAHNRIEWIDAFFGTLKIGAVPVNINYKYLRDELAYLYDNADCVAAVIAPEYVDHRRRPRSPPLKHVLVMDESYAAAMAAAGGERPGVDRSDDDHYVIYTGGTTGSPEGRRLARRPTSSGRPSTPPATARRSSRSRRWRWRRRPTRTRWC